MPRDLGISWSLMHMQKRGQLALQIPIIVIKPVASPDVLLQGEVCTCDTGTWSYNPAPTYSYQWTRDGVNIGGATANTYTIQAADITHVLNCVVTATNSQGSTSQASNNVYAVSAFAPTNTFHPTVMGTPSVGQTLSCDPGTWDTGPFPAPTYTYQWELDGVNISGATGSTYVVQTNDASHDISCKVTATNSQGSGIATSPPVTINSAPYVLVNPTISGSPAVGQTLTLSQGMWAGYPVPTLTNQWLRDGANIAGETGSTYLIVSGDTGKNIACRVTATNTWGTVSAVSNGFVIGASLSAPVNTVAPVVSGIPQLNQTLSCTTGTWTGNPSPTYSYKWYKNGVFLSNGNTADNSLLTLSAGLGIAYGDALTCQVTGTNSQGNATASSNSLTYEQTPAAPVNTVAPVVSPDQSFGDSELLTCSTGTWSGYPAPTFSYQWLNNSTPISGATNSTYTTQVADLLATISCQVTATNSQGSASATSNGVSVLNNVGRLMMEDGGFLLLEDGGFLLLE